MPKIHFLTFLIAILLSHSIKSQKVKSIKFGDLRVSYTLNEGKLDGKYQSYYPNQQLKAEGRFENNYRIGKWIVWDSNGVKQVERDYSTPFNFEQSFPPLQNKVEYNLAYNPKGYIDYFHVEEEMILWYKRVWRKLKAKENPILFEKDFLFTVLTQLINDSIISTYDNDSFQQKVTVSSKENNKLLYYKLKEDWFFDNERRVMEARIIGICPVVETDGKTKKLYWLYFPELIEHFATKPLMAKTTSPHVHSLFDLFFFRFFCGTIYKDSFYSIYNTTDNKVENKDISIIESEHALWINLN